MKKFFSDENGVIALIVAIIAPLIVGLLVLSFDGANMLLKQARLQDALREASLGANTLSSEGEKRKFIESYLKVYFNNKNINFSNISIAASKFKSKNQSGQMEDTEILNSYAEMSVPRWFSKSLIKEEATSLKAKVSLEPSKIGRAHV